MNPHELNSLHVIHVSAAFALLGYTFYACAAAPDSKKRVLMITGIASLLMLLTGVRMWQGVFGFHAAGWIVVKLACWLGLSALGGVAYRKRDSANGLMLGALLLTVTAVAMAFIKPF
jgi:hypothetical protein